MVNIGLYADVATAAAIFLQLLVIHDRIPWMNEQQFYIFPLMIASGNKRNKYPPNLKKPFLTRRKDISINAQATKGELLYT